MVIIRESEGCRASVGKSMAVVANAMRSSSCSSFSRVRCFFSRVRRLPSVAGFRPIHRGPLAGGMRVLNFLRFATIPSPSSDGHTLNKILPL